MRPSPPPRLIDQSPFKGNAREFRTVLQKRFYGIYIKIVCASSVARLQELKKVSAGHLHWIKRDHCLLDVSFLFSSLDQL